MADFDKLSVRPGFAPMEAKSVDELPDGEGWRYEPKWDGFRCLVFRDGDAIELRSKSGKPLGRYFPEMVEAVRAMKADRFVLDGELIIPIGGILSFDALQLRLHPAESRSAASPPRLRSNDAVRLPRDGAAGSLIERPLAERRDALEALHRREQAAALKLRPSPGARRRAVWLDTAGGALDGVVARGATVLTSPAKRASQDQADATPIASSAASATRRRAGRSAAAARPL